MYNFVGLLVLLITTQSGLSYVVDKDLGSYPMRCSTVDGQACVFPYQENGSEVNQCVNSRCPTKVDLGTLEAKEWADCDQSSCVIDCSTLSRKRCVFPFVFEENDQVWNRRCAKNTKGTFVCATQVDPETNFGLEYESCDLQTCPLD